MIIKCLKLLVLAVVSLVLSLVGLSAMRFVCAVVDKFTELFGYHFAYWHALGLSSFDGMLLGAWLSALFWMGLTSWVTVWCFGHKPIHWATVLLLWLIGGGICAFLISNGALAYWPVTGTIMVIIMGFCVMILAKKLGFNRFGLWLAEKGKWWWLNVIIPWLVVPLVGFFAWPLLLVLLWWLAPGWHATLLTEVVPWMVQWIVRPVAELLVDTVHEVAHLIRS